MAQKNVSHMTSSNLGKPQMTRHLFSCHSIKYDGARHHKNTSKIIEKYGGLQLTSGQLSGKMKHSQKGPKVTQKAMPDASNVWSGR